MIHDNASIFHVISRDVFTVFIMKSSTLQKGSLDKTVNFIIGYYYVVKFNNFNEIIKISKHFLGGIFIPKIDFGLNTIIVFVIANVIG